MIFFLIMLPIGVIYLIFAQKYGAEKMKKEYQFFNTNNICGIIKEVNCSKEGCKVKLIGSVKEFAFFPYTSAFSDNRIFSLTALPGDSIVKNAYSDSLILIKTDKRYVYTFRKPKK
jgi:hypothetical protein